MKKREDGPTVLFIGASSRSFSHIARRLEKSGCQCRYAKSYADARQFLQGGGIDLVLSVSHPHDNAISSVADMLAGTQASFFYAVPVEESCWWLPALRRGEPCLGAPALRPSEFSGVLDEVVAEILATRSQKQTSVQPAKARKAEPATAPEAAPKPRS